MSLFSRNFDLEIADERAAIAHQKLPVYTGAQIETAVSQARKNGFDEGRKAAIEEAREHALSKFAQQRNIALESIGPAVRDLFSNADRHKEALERQVLEFALSIFERLVPDIVQSQAIKCARDEIQKAINMAKGSSRLTIRLSQPALADCKDELLNEIEKSGFTGRVDVASDPKMQSGDAHVEWDNGFMDYAFTEICDQVSRVLKASITELTSTDAAKQPS